MWRSKLIRSPQIKHQNLVVIFYTIKYLAWVPGVKFATSRVLFVFKGIWGHRSQVSLPTKSWTQHQWKKDQFQIQFRFERDKNVADNFYFCRHSIPPNVRGCTLDRFLEWSAAGCRPSWRRGRKFPSLWPGRHRFQR